MVVTGRRLKAPGLFALDFDNFEGGAPRHPAPARRWATAASPSSPATRRTPTPSSACAATAQHWRRPACAYDPDLVVPGQYHEESGLAAVERLLDSGSRLHGDLRRQRPDGLRRRLALYRRSLRVPTGCVAGRLRRPAELALPLPPLTTVHHPAYELGQQAALALLQLLRGEKPAGEVPAPRVIVRESSRAPALSAAWRRGAPPQLPSIDSPGPAPYSLKALSEMTRSPAIEAKRGARPVVGSRGQTGWTRWATPRVGDTPGAGCWAQPCSAAATLPVQADPQVLTVAAFPAVDEIVRAAMPAWKRLHPNVADQGRQPAVRRPPHRDDDGAVDLGLPARRDGARGRLRRPLRAGRRARRSCRSRRTTSQRVRRPLRALRLRRRRPTAAATSWRCRPTSARARCCTAPTCWPRPAWREADLTAVWEAYVAAGVQHQGRHRRLPDRPTPATMKDILIRTGIAAGRGAVLRPGLAGAGRARRASCAPSSWRARCAGTSSTRASATWSNEWTEGFKRGTLATQMSGAWMAGQMANWLAPEHQGPVARGAAARRHLRGLRRHLLRHPARAPARPQGPGLGADPAADAGPRRCSSPRSSRRTPSRPCWPPTTTPSSTSRCPSWAGSRRACCGATRRAASPRSQVHKQDNFADEVIDTELDNVLDRGKDIAHGAGRCRAPAAAPRPPLTPPTRPCACP